MLQHPSSSSSTTVVLFGQPRTTPYHQSQKWRSTAARLSPPTSHGGSHSCGSAKMKSSLCGPGTIAIEQCVGLSRSHCYASGASGSTNAAIAGAPPGTVGRDLEVPNPSTHLPAPPHGSRRVVHHARTGWRSTAAIARSPSPEDAFQGFGSSCQRSIQRSTRMIGVKPTFAVQAAASRVPSTSRGEIVERIGEALHQEHPDTGAPMRGHHEDVGNPAEGNAVMEHAGEADLCTGGAYTRSRSTPRSLAPVRPVTGLAPSTTPPR